MFNLNPKIKSNNFWGSMRTTSSWWPLGNSKWFSNYNLEKVGRNRFGGNENQTFFVLAETKIKFFGGND